MTIPIIIEGPDESGKTTLAIALLGYFYPDVGLLKSPAGKSPDWYPYFDNWVGRVTTAAAQSILLLDRVPEISEAVYGPIMRGSSRLNSPLGSLLNLPKNGLVIFCQFPRTRPRGDLFEEHTVTGGRIIMPSDQLAIAGAYKIVESFVKQFVPVIQWQYWNYHWNSLISKLPVKLPTVNLSFEEALGKGRSIVEDLPKEAFS